MALVTEARPIPWTQLTANERELVAAINTMMAEIIDDALCTPSDGAHVGPGTAIDSKRTGRVLLIDGLRGSGKSSLLLTLLNQWQHHSRKGSEALAPDHELGFDGLDRLEVLHPVPLDFDPLPPGMPLHGWLLLPWRTLAMKCADGDANRDPESEALLDTWTNLFESAVVGWSGVPPNGKNVVEQALGYQDQALDWFGMATRYRSFVDRIGRSRSESVSCHGVQKLPVFVISIDDVDLQVERLPELLHAVRLLYHPNVVYVLTGDRGHLEFVVHLDYLRQHTQKLPTMLPADSDVRRRCEKASQTLAGALLAKALPEHATFTLHPLSFSEVLNFGKSQETLGLLLQKTVSVQPEKSLNEVLGQAMHAKPPLPLVLARQAQHAVDQWLKDPAIEDARCVGLFRALLGDPSQDAMTSQKDKRSKDFPFQISGKLTTYRSSSIRRYGALPSHIFVAGARPRLVFIASDETRTQGEQSATRALLTRTLVEEEKVHAPQLAWDPDAGMLWTEYQWQGRELVFHWPWLSKPKATELIPRFGEWHVIAANIVELQTDEPTTLGALLAAWLGLNLKWNGKVEKDAKISDFGDNPKDAEIERAIKGWIETAWANKDKVKDEEAKKDTARKQEEQRQGEETERWFRELALAAAPYYGLPEVFVNALLAALDGCTNLRRRIPEEENKVFSSALASDDIKPRLQTSVATEPLSEKEIEAKLQEFRAYYTEHHDGHPWLEWMKNRKRRLNRKGTTARRTQ